MPTRVIRPISIKYGVLVPFFMREAAMDESQHTNSDHAHAPSVLEQKLAVHITHTPLAYIEWDLDFAVLDWNPAAEQIFGYTRAEALGRHAGDLIVTPEVRPILDQIWRDLIEQRAS